MVHFQSVPYQYILTFPKGEEGDCTGVEGHDAQTEDVDTPGTPSWLRMPKEDDTSDGVKHVELQKQVMNQSCVVG